LKNAPVTWLIDLDNTLHNASHAIFPAMHLKMNAYMAELLGTDRQPADEATVDATRLRYAHEFDNLSQMMRFESGLKNLLTRLPGNKILFTNAPRDYAQQVLKQMGLQRHLKQHISIEAMQVHGKLRPKPSRWLLKKLIARRALNPARCVLIEDSRENLKSAKQMGMKTVWITQYVNHDSIKAPRFARARFIDIKIRSVKKLPAQLSRLTPR